MDPAKLKVVELRAELAALGLDTKGNKPVLVERLREALATQGQPITDSTILDTSTEEVEEAPPDTSPRPRRPGPASRTRRRQSSSEQTTPTTPVRSSRRELDSSIAKNAQRMEDIIETPKTAPVAEDLNVSDQECILADTPIQTHIEDDVKAQQPEPQQCFLKQEVTSDTIKEVSTEIIPVDEPKISVVCEDLPVETEKPHTEQIEEIQNEEQSQTVEPMDTCVLRTDVHLENTSISDSNQKEKESEELDTKENILKTEIESPTKRQEESVGENQEIIKSEIDETLNVFNIKQESCSTPLKDVAKEETKDEHRKEGRHTDNNKTETSKNDTTKEEKNQEGNKRESRRKEKYSRWGYSRNADSSTPDNDVQVTGEYISIRDDDDERGRGRTKRSLKRTRDPSPHRKSPIRKPEPEFSPDKITISWYDSDLNLHIDLPMLNSAAALTDGGFAYCWAGARASHGVNQGRVCFEVRIESMHNAVESCPPCIRFGWSTLDSSLHLGDSPLSWGYENTGRKVNSGEFEDYGPKLKEKDVVGVYVDFGCSPCIIMYTVNGESQGTAFEFDKEILQGVALFPHVASRSCSYRVNYGHDKYAMLSKVTRRQLESSAEDIDGRKRIWFDEACRTAVEERRRCRALWLQTPTEDRKQNYRRAWKEARNVIRSAKRRFMLDEVSNKEKQTDEKNEDSQADIENIEKKDKGDEKYDPLKCSDDEQDMLEDKEIDDKMDILEDKMDVLEDKMVVLEDKTDVLEEKMETSESQSENIDDSVKAESAEDKTNESPNAKSLIIRRNEADIEIYGKEAQMLEDYIFISKMSSEQLSYGPQKPPKEEQCDVIMMCGLPGSGKTYWSQNYTAMHLEKRFNILGTNALLEKMKIDCKPFKPQYNGKWNILISKITKCVLRLIEIAQTRRRNYILDQTNVYPSAQRRKMREFIDCKRTAVVIVPDEATYKERQQLREEKDGKDVPDAAVLEMKANFVLPEVCSWMDEVIFTELNEEEAKKILDKYNKEGRAAAPNRGSMSSVGSRGRSRSGAGGRSRSSSGAPSLPKRSRFENISGDRGRRSGDRGRYGSGPSRNRDDSRRDDRRPGGGTGWGGRHSAGSSGGWGSDWSGSRDQSYGRDQGYNRDYGREQTYGRNRGRDGSSNALYRNTDRWGGRGGGQNRDSRGANNGGSSVGGRGASASGRGIGNTGRGIGGPGRGIGSSGRGIIGSGRGIGGNMRGIGGVGRGGSGGGRGSGIGGRGGIMDRNRGDRNDFMGKNNWGGQRGGGNSGNAMRNDPRNQRQQPRQNGPPGGQGRAGNPNNADNQGGSWGQQQSTGGGWSQQQAQGGNWVQGNWGQAQQQPQQQSWNQQQGWNHNWGAWGGQWNKFQGPQTGQAQQPNPQQNQGQWNQWGNQWQSYWPASQWPVANQKDNASKGKGGNSNQMTAGEQTGAQATTATTQQMWPQYQSFVQGFNNNAAVNNQPGQEKK